MKPVYITNSTKINYNFPNSWEDLSLKQIKRIHRYVMLYRIDATYAIKIILVALGLPISYTFNKKKRNRVENIVTLPGEWLHHILHDESLLGWILKPDGMLKYPLKKFTCRGKTYHGPTRFILDVKTIELVSAYSFFYYYSTTQKEEYLNKMIAILYRPARIWWRLEKFTDSFERDIRQKLNAYHWEKQTKAIRRLDWGVKNTILRMFSSEWAAFEKDYPLVFSKSGDSKYNHDMWIKLLIQMSGGAFGTLEETKMTSADEVFKHIQMKMEESLKIKDSIKNNK
jgi:hypothetical protein